MKKVILVVVLMVVVVLHGSDDGIVTIQGYEHATAMCGVEAGATTDVVPVGGGWFSDGGYMWAEDGIMYVINQGHMHDDEVVQLKVLATTTCAQYR